MIESPDIERELDELSDRELLEAIWIKLQRLSLSHDDIKVQVRRINDQVTPIIDRLEGSPILKMLGGK